jgi:hypothetical protein
VTYQVQVNTNYGEEVWVCGSDKALGNWLPTKGIKMKTTVDAYPLWSGQVLLPVCHSSLLLQTRSLLPLQ